LGEINKTHSREGKGGWSDEKSYLRMRDIVSPFSTISGKSPKGKYIILCGGSASNN